MHELPVLVKTIETVEGVAARNDVRRIAYVTLEVGELTGYLPVFFERYWPVATEDKPLFRGSELRIREVRGQALCQACGALYNVVRCEGACPACASRSKTILGGQDLQVLDIGVAE